MKKKLSTRKGFTLAEVLIVVAIMGIVAAFGFIAVHTYKKNMKNLEMQSAAKEIYLASQEHLTLAKSEKLLDDVSSETSGFTATTTGKIYHPAYNLGLQESDSYYVVTSEDLKDVNTKTNSVLNVLLPNNSIEEYIRGNYYAIRYSKKSYQVTDVFYSDDKAFGDYLKSGEFKSGDDKVVASGWKELTDHYTTGPNDLNGAFIGYYGADEYYMEIAEETGAPIVKVNNGETLSVTITLPYERDKYDGNIILIVAQENYEERSSKIEVSDFSINTSSGKWEQTVVLDDVTSESTTFNKIVNTHLVDTDKPIILGSDIAITAEAVLKDGASYTTTTNGTTTTTPKNATVTSNTVYTNSLFSDNTVINDNDGTMTAHISNFRHLENLGSDISGFAYDTNLYKEATKAQSNGFTAVMDKGLDWSKAKDGDVFKTYNYKPIDPTYQLRFNGNNKRISNLTVTTDSPAGVFGTISTSGEIKALNIYNAQVSGGSEDAGSLIGKIDISSGELNIIGTVARNTTAKGDSQTADGVVTTGNAGGLIGSINNTGGKVTVTQSAASVYVNGGTSAGGLIGSTSGAVTISESYAGGHTKDGKYQETIEGQGRYNVIATSVAGGLIGNSSSQTTASYTYATTSVYGANAGK